MMDVDPRKIKHWLNFARNVSKHSKYRTQVGCVICKGNRPISVGFNKAKYSKKWSNPWRKSIHAECDAIRNSGKERVKNSTVFVFRETKDGLPGMARPCVDCLARLISFGIRTLVYSVDYYPFWEIEKI
jgi:deoxycytidylate deaminase